MLRIGIKSDIGKKRENNQDTFHVSKDPSMPIYLVADGMGGHKAGEIASHMVRDIVVSSFSKNKDSIDRKKDVLKLVKKSIEEANTKTYLKSIENKEYKGMGTTITLAYIYKNEIYLGHVGDSRAYLIRNGEINQITEDHSYVNQLIKSGSITKEEGKTHPKRNMITRAVGTSSIIEIDLIVKGYNKNDILVLCSDGLFNMVSDIQILEKFKSEEDIEKACEELVEMANNKGGLDNITVLAMKFV